MKFYSSVLNAKSSWYGTPLTMTVSIWRKKRWIRIFCCDCSTWGNGSGEAAAVSYGFTNAGPQVTVTSRHQDDGDRGLFLQFCSQSSTWSWKKYFLCCFLARSTMQLSPIMYIRTYSHVKICFKIILKLFFSSSIMLYTFSGHIR